MVVGICSGVVGGCIIDDVVVGIVFYVECIDEVLLDQVGVFVVEVVLIVGQIGFLVEVVFVDIEEVVQVEYDMVQVCIGIGVVYVQVM